MIKVTYRTHSFKKGFKEPGLLSMKDYKTGTGLQFKEGDF